MADKQIDFPPLQKEVRLARTVHARPLLLIVIVVIILLSDLDGPFIGPWRSVLWAMCHGSISAARSAADNRQRIDLGRGVGPARAFGRIDAPRLSFVRQRTRGLADPPAGMARAGSGSGFSLSPRTARPSHPSRRCRSRTRRALRGQAWSSCRRRGRPTIPRLYTA